MTERNKENKKESNRESSRDGIIESNRENSIENHKENSREKKNIAKESINKKDVILILALCLLAAALYLFMGRSAGKEQVVITLDGKQYGTYSLYETKTIEVESKWGKNVVVIENGQVHIESADCPDRYCVKQGKLPTEHDNGKAIICLPHKLVVEIK